MADTGTVTKKAGSDTTGFKGRGSLEAMTATTDIARVVVFNQVEDLRIERQGDAWAARSEQHEGVVGFGETCDRAIQNARESLMDRLRVTV